MDVSEFDYRLPDDAIAQTPMEPRDAARLLDTTTMADHVFAELPDLLAPGDLVVVNDTRVRAARLRGVRHPTGGAVELLVLARRPSGTWECLVRPARRLRSGSVVRIGRIEATLLSDPDDGLAEVRLNAPGDIEAAIGAEGVMPLPPYIRSTLEDPDRYQTVYAADPGSSAAPTAGLHFTPRVFERLEERGIDVARVELRVGLDTFRPISTDRVEDHRMHSEWASVPRETVRAISATRARRGSVVAIGTTVVRALESRSEQDGTVRPGATETDLFITPGYRFRVVDRLVTNFHLPASTLICMVAAFMGPAWRTAYETALERGYRFLSFGDAMLAERSRS